MEDQGMGGQEIDPVHPPTLEPQAPWLITQLVAGCVGVVSSYGWPCLLLALCAVFIYNKYKPAIHSWQRRREDQKEAALYHKNPDILLARETAMEQARLRMQEQYAADSTVHAEKMKAREEERRRVKLAEAEAKQRVEGGQRLRPTEVPDTAVTAQPKKRAKFRPEYNPLQGSGPSSGFRPARRGGSGGG